MPASDARVETILTALIAFENAMTPLVPKDMASFRQARVRLAISVNEFFSGEQSRLNDLALLGFSEADQAEQQTLYRALIDVRMRYSAHIGKWTNANVAGEWRSYRSDSVSLIIALRKLLMIRAEFRAPRAA